MCRRRWSDRGRWQSDRMAAYLAKYLAKGFADTGGDGRHAYAVSRGLTWRVERYAVRALTYEGVAGLVFRLADGWTGVSVFQRPDSGLIWMGGRSQLSQAPPE